MKYILLISWFVSCWACAANSVTIAKGYKDSRAYTTIQSTTNNMKMVYAGNLMDLPPKLRIRMPLRIVSETELVSTAITGAISSDSSYPLTVSYDNNITRVSINGGEYKEQPNGIELKEVTIKGHIDPSGNAQFETAEGPTVTKEFVAIMKSVFEQMTDSNFIAEREIHIGESVSGSIPMVIPAGEGQILLNTSIVYTLTEIVDTLAKFDINMDIIVSAELEEANIEADLVGSGTMLYDIHKEISPDTQMKINANIRIPTEKKYFDISYESLTRTKVSVDLQ